MVVAGKEKASGCARHSDESGGERVRVLAYVSPFTGKLTYALWCADRPVVAANNYLRAHSHLELTSQKTVAYNLLPWCRFLDRNGLLSATGQTYWGLDVRSAESLVAGSFKSELDGLRRSDAITDATAEKYLEAAFFLCRWWRQDGEPTFGTVVVKPVRGPIPNKHRAVTVDIPAVWRLPPRKDGPTRPPKELPQEAIDAVWTFLTEECRPRRPEILRSKPRADWSEGRRRAYTAARDSYDYQRSLYCRDLAVWGVLEASGCRLSEAPLVAVEDVLTHDGNDRQLLLRFVQRDATRHLGRLKTGAHTAYIGMSTRAVDAVTAWLNQREIIVERAERKGLPPHPVPMLLTKDNGAPLTTGAIVALFRRIRAHVDEIYPDGLPTQAITDVRASTSPAPRHRLVRSSAYPHRLRHTLMTVMRSGGVSPEVRRQQLGHTSTESQDAYGGLYDATLVTSLDRMVAKNAERAGTPGIGVRMGVRGTSTSGDL